MCTASPVAERARADCLAAVPGTHDLGIVRDASRCADRRSAHCCGDRAENPAARNLDVVLAWDCGHAVGDRATAAKVTAIFLDDPRVDYVISFGVLYKPDGSTQDNTGHEDHVHITFDPSSAHDTRPFHAGPQPLTDTQKLFVLLAAKKYAQRLPELGRGHLRKPRRRSVAKLQQLLGMRPTGVYGSGTRNKVRAVQAFFRLPVTGIVDETTWMWIIYGALTKGRR